MSTQPTMPACEALAADPARYMFKEMLRSLRAAEDYEQRYSATIRIFGYLAALLEADLIDTDRFVAIHDELHARTWEAQA